MLRSHADLTWDFGPCRAGISLPQVRFPTGRIDSRQIGLVWSATTDFRYVERDRIGTPMSISGRSGMGFNLNPALALRVGAGRIKSLKGALNSSVVDLTLAFTFGVAGHGYR